MNGWLGWRSAGFGVAVWWVEDDGRSWFGSDGMGWWRWIALMAAVPGRSRIGRGFLKRGCGGPEERVG